MSKKRKPQAQTPPMSPEKYIKTQARKLPIHQCLINTGWKTTGMCSILVTRQHSNGNFTSGIYLVDIFCLGVKEAECTFNETPNQYKDFKDKYFPEDIFEEIDYTLAHNIIYAGIEFAEDYGFHPCKEFGLRGQYILEEDTDDIELIEIECGKNNMPYVINADENREEATKVHDHLVKTVGVDGFLYSDMQVMGGDMEDDLFFDDEDLDEDDYVEDLPIEEYLYDQPLSQRIEDINRFKELVDVEKHTSDDEAVELLFISKRLFYNYYDIIKIEASRNQFMKFLDVELNDEGIPASLRGTQSLEHDEKIEEILDALDFGDDLKKLGLKKLVNRFPEIPFYSYMHIVEMSINQVDIKKIAKQINNYQSIYPNYLMLKIENDQFLSLLEKETQLVNDKLINESSLSKLFGNRTSIHSMEFMAFHSALFEHLISKQDLLALDSFIYATNMLFPEMADAFSEKELFSELCKVDFCKHTYSESAD